MTHINDARKMDEMDELYTYRDRFALEEGVYYMDGNSLGLCSIDAKETLLDVLDVWEKEGIKIWGTQEGKYYQYPRFLGEKMRRLIGANADEVVAMGTITSNLHQALTTFYKPTEKRYKILVDDLNFPSDIYAVQSVIELNGLSLEKALKKVVSKDGKTLDEDEIIRAMTEDVALILLPSVLYRSAQILNMKEITQAAHDRGILIGWDLAHGIGAIPYDFKDINPDFAVWCTYKYLNGGPGSTAGLYINRRHFGENVGLKGWFGCKPETQFAMSHTFDPAMDARAFLQGTPNMLSMAPLEGSLNLFLEIGMEKLRTKSLALTSFLADLIEERLKPLGFSNGTPMDPTKRGGHIALEHQDAYLISLAMRKAGVIPDFREPNIIRLAPVPLYVGFEDVYCVVEIIEKIMMDKTYKDVHSTEQVY